MAKQRPFTAQEERLERLIKNARAEVVVLKGMIDTARSIVAAQIIKVDDPSSPQIIRVSEEGNLETGEGSLPWWGAITEEASHTGDTAETTLGTITIPGGKMGPNGFARISVICRVYQSAIFHVYFGQIQTANKIGYYQHTGGIYYLSAHPLYVWNKGAANSQSGEEPDQVGQLAYHYAAAGTPQGMNEDTTQDVNVYFTVQNAAAGHISYLYFALVEVFYRD